VPDRPQELGATKKVWVLGAIRHTSGPWMVLATRKMLKHSAVLILHAEAFTIVAVTTGSPFAM